jgi:hypothetical protein
MSGLFRGEPDLRCGTEFDLRRFDIGMPRAQKLPRSRTMNSLGVEGVMDTGDPVISTKLLLSQSL